MYLDGPLSAAIGAVETLITYGQDVNPLPVFIEVTTPLDTAAIEQLQQCGCGDQLEQNRKLITARLTIEQIRQLANQPWIKRIALSTKSMLLG